MFNAVTLVVLLRRKLGGLDEGRIAASLARILAASLAMGAVVVIIDHYALSLLTVGGFTGKLLRVAAGIVGGLAALAIAARVLRVTEFTEAVGLVQAKVLRRVNR
jgi:hypothetical protein